MFFYAPATKSRGYINLPLSVRSSCRPFVRPSVHLSVQIQIHGLSQFWSYSFNILQDVYTHNGGVHVHRILIFFKYSQNDRQLDLSHFVRLSGYRYMGLSGYLLLHLSLQTHLIIHLLKITPSKTTLSIIIKYGGILLFQFN